MKKHLLIKVTLAALLPLLTLSCAHTLEEEVPGSRLPVGTPITMRLDFGASESVKLDVSTKAESSRADEERIHDLYVMIFCNNPEHQHHKQDKDKIYGRYFSYEHLNRQGLESLEHSNNEGWWVENKTLDTAPQEIAVAKTAGAVKISTQVCDAATVVVIANLDNSICKLGNLDDQIAYLNGIQTFEQLRSTQVRLQQDIVNRKDLFLMMGTLENVNTENMVWGTLPKNYNQDYKVSLKALDAKVKFKVSANEEFIRAVKPVNWSVNSVPDRCYLFADYDGGRAPEGTVYFDSEPAYFDGMEGDDYVFSFYMLESRNEPKAHATQYHDREKQTKHTTDKNGYGGHENEYFVENGEWIYALPQAPYVKFDLMLTLTPAAVEAMVGGTFNNALTTETVYTVHLGDFDNSSLRYDDYNTLRSTCYTYDILIHNSGSIYAEVIRDEENQPSQEGYLLLANDEIVNADCHYENHSITFEYDPDMSADKFSWYVKTPFTTPQGGGPVKDTKEVNGIKYPVFDPHDSDGTLLDYRWVKFSVNEQDNVKGYKTQRVAYPGDKKYDPDWGVGENGPWNDESHPKLMDASQFIQYIFEQTKRANEGEENDFKVDYTLGDNTHEVRIIRATIFIDEFYYEYDPRDESGHPQTDPNLWRKFVNTQPREMHILSKTVQSRDRKSDVIESSHSIVQQSIQTIYNVFEPSLRSIWGCEHMDEIKVKEENGTLLGNWPYWPVNCSDSERSGANNDIGKENGRLNSAFIWGLYSNQGNNGQYYTTNGQGRRYWKHFLKYEVDNTIPELRDDDGETYGNDDASHHFHGMAWSCLARNRDNNGNGTIEQEEVRWYLASSQQLAGIWVGTSSLSASARLYQPAADQWRAHVVSSTAKLVSWAEEGGGATDIRFDFPPSGGPNTNYHTWDSWQEASKGESVRCIRNIGTYDDPQKGLTDITYSPVTELPDKYFTITRSDGGDVNSYTAEDSDQYYIFHFDRLNTKSIREYTTGELPYHDQMSQNNQVYVKMVTQSLDQDVPAFNVKAGEINNLVTQAGHNDYCPEGYRFPNHTEFLLMSLYLPQSYLQKDKDGNSYSGGRAVSPTRTYYDKGYYGSLKDPAWEMEYEKIGWIYSDKLHCVGYNEKVTHSRCVKDSDQTGIISGKIAVEGNIIYPGDVIPVDFKFSSTASTFTNATLTLWYSKNGFRTPYDLTSQLKTPKGLQYIGTQGIQIPTLTDLGLASANLPYEDMALEVVLTNLNGLTGSHTLNVSMVNPLDANFRVKDPVDGNKIFPDDQNAVSFNLHTNTHEQNLSSVSLKLCYDDKEIPLNIEQLGINKKTYTLDEIHIPALNDLTGVSVDLLNTADKAVTLKATVSITYNNTRMGGTETLTKEYTQNLALSNPVRGTIDGANYLYPAGNEGNVNFNFQTRSHNGTLNSALLKLQYTLPGTGEPAEYDLQLDQQPSAREYTPGQVVRMPRLTDLGLSATDLPLSATLLAEVSDANGLKAQSSKSVTVKSHFGGTVDIVGDFDPVNGFPITIATSAVSNLSVEQVTLRWKKEGDANYTEQTITNPGSSVTAYWHPSFLDNDTDVLSDNSQTRTYYFTAIVGNSDDAGVIGLNESADPATMEFFKINYNPNPGNWTQANQPPASSKWYAQTISNMNFGAGDFIDTYMDVSNCTYDPKNPNGPVDGGKDLGMDNLLSLGYSTQTADGKPGLEWRAGNGNFIFYYPARNGENNNLQIASLTNAISRIQPFSIDSGKLKVMLKRSNNQGHLMLNNYGSAQEVEPNWLQEIRDHTPQEKEDMAVAAQGRLDELTNRSTVYIGSTEGVHRSRAVYKYVRVVRKHN